MQLNPYRDKCLCGSGSVLLDCCLKDCRPRPKSRLTGRRNPKCYAAPLGDCSPRISREHFITEGVLKLIGDPITIGGFPWLDGRQKSIATDGLTAKILCERHNSALAELDQTGIRFFDKLRAPSFTPPTEETVAKPRISLFRGEMLELWMLKVLCGLIASGNAPDGDGKQINARVPIPWLRILFWHQPMPPGWGMYMPGEVGSDFSGIYPNQMRVIYAEGVLNGLIISLQSLSFVLVANHPPPDKKGTLLEPCTYRPGEIVLNSQAGQDILRIFWEKSGEERSITIACSSTTAEGKEGADSVRAEAGSLAREC